MAITKHNGDLISFIKQKDYIMINNDLGGGSFGKTVLLKDPFIDELFVAKKYAPECDEDKEQYYHNFLDEIKIMYKLNHRNIVRIYNYYAHEDSYTGYILMEYINGNNIGDYFNDYSSLGETSANDIFIQLIDAFCYIEAKNIIHRDIREGNILIDSSGVVKVIDFGIGKFFSKPDEANDSLVEEINRANSDSLPQEYFDGTYTNLTDMFYLAELFNRLLSNAGSCISRYFSYNDILEKMMKKHPEDRFASFDEVRKAINRHGFQGLSFSEEDKKIYLDFTNVVRESISSYMEKPEFDSDTQSFLSKLKIALSSNSFESVIQNNCDVIRSIVLCGYRYKTNVKIPTNVTERFIDWFSASSFEVQTLILNNFISKLSIIKVDEPEPDLPF